MKNQPKNKVSPAELPETTLQDTIIASKQLKQIERAKQEWEITVDTLAQLICLLDQQRHIIRANRTVERWQLGQVVAVEGQEIHKFLHGDCSDSSCYLVTFLKQAWEKLTQGQRAELEAKDKILNRYLHLKIEPIALQITKEIAHTASFAVLILEDISKQKQAETVLRQYTFDLKRQNEELDAFSHTVAHDLKGPLVPIIGYAELLSQAYTVMSAEQIRKNLAGIIQSGKKMSKIISELLFLASVRKMDVNMEPLDMTAIIFGVQERLAYMIKEHQAQIIWSIDSEWPTALGYGPWVEEVWVNYMSNAIKYGDRPPRLELGVDPPLLMPTNKPKDKQETYARQIRFWIRDNGPGLTPEEQAKLFMPFTQLSVGQNDGYGLGLSIVRRIVRKLGGQVGVESEGIPGQGCVFSFTLLTDD